MFKAPKFELKPKRVVEIPFRGTLLTTVMETLNSRAIPYPFKVIKVKMIFTEEANYLVSHRWHILRSRFISATAGPLADNLFGRESPTADFSGRSIIRTLECNVEFPEGNRIIALYTDNNSPFTYRYECSATIEELD